MATDRLTCEQVFRRLDDFVDRELTPEETLLVEEHLEECAACLAEYRFERGVVDELKAKLRRVEAPPGLLARITARLRDADLDV